MALTSNNISDNTITLSISIMQDIDILIVQLIDSTHASKWKIPGTKNLLWNWLIQSLLGQEIQFSIVCF